jgi:DNA polymerase III, delta prime subunit (EC 2.7.7.7)
MQGEIVVETVAQAGKFLRLTPGEGGWRVVIVDGAEASTATPPTPSSNSWRNHPRAPSGS